MVEMRGKVNGQRVSSKELDERIQEAVRNGKRRFRVIADGQHGIGGRIWPQAETVKVRVTGAPGQRVGGMAMMGTEIVIEDSASDDVGWLNTGATITVLGDVANGAHNAGAQGKLYVQGSGGARCDTLTKFNPRFEPIQSWYFRDVGDSFAEFKAGGIAVVCGVNPRNPGNILGYRPCVGMVGGTIYFRGPIQGVSEVDVRIAEMTEADWEWLQKNMKPFLKAVDRMSFYQSLTRSRDEWRKVVPLTPNERDAAAKARRMSMARFRTDTWYRGVGQGGIFADYLDTETTILPYVVRGADRRQRPIWENDQYAPPCAGYCPTGIPTHERTRLLREGSEEAALDLVLRYSPFPGTVCGYVCPNLCMDNCSRQLYLTDPVDVTYLGRLSLDRPAPPPEPSRTERVAVLGAGPAGMSAAYQLALRGYRVSLYEREERLGGKIYYCIPEDRLPREILQKEIDRFESLGIDVHTGTDVDRKRFEEIRDSHDVVILASGCHSPRVLPFPGYEHVVPGIVFLKELNARNPMDLKGKNVVVIGAGNVGMDICVEAFNCGAAAVTAVDIQKPASFGKEQKLAKARGTEILYPKFTDRYDHAAKTIHFKDGSSLPADVVFISIGETPELDYLPQGIDLERGYVRVDNAGQTTDPKVFAIGDATQPGLITNAIGAGLTVARYVHSLLAKTEYEDETKKIIPYERIRYQWYERSRESDLSRTCSTEGNKCMSCGSCRDCHLCETVCYWGAISRRDLASGAYEYVVDEDRCIGCGFCAGACPCGIWTMYEN
jgi:NADPH-dependent glutamate synthase beta subunit-like oxidoreductase/glutamate synthase domain-containing protein 3/Pyruvate/2-oxoacid:ferredoxin oxidoreductase delta subunit